jgi:hypothetical protein
VASFSPNHGQQCLLGPGLEAAEIGAALAQLGHDPEIAKLVLFGSRARGNTTISNFSAPVPGPLPLLGVGAAFGYSRRLRRRINLSTGPVSSASGSSDQL